MQASTIGTVFLKVHDLELMSRFYQDIIGLHVRHEDDAIAVLGAGDDDLLVLQASDGAHYPGVTGLYHFALLLPTRLALARSLQHFIHMRTRLQGASDHLVSEALYLADPEGNGIEIYWDRPRETWFRAGELQMDTVPLDIQDLINELAVIPPEEDVWTGLPAGTTVGHIHLHVASIQESEHFYREILGLDVLFNIGSALFMSYEGYHHHIGANVWGGRNVPPSDALGLDKFVLRLADADQRNTIVDRLITAQIPVDKTDDGYLTHDPSNNAILLVA
ncbi:MAG: VOC family protein [Aggregatilineales bacterium]